MVAVAAIAVAAVSVAEETLNTEEALFAAFIAAPVAFVAAEKGKLVVIAPALAAATDVAPDTEPWIKTNRPTLVYVPAELKAPTKVNPAP